MDVQNVFQRLKDCAPYYHNHTLRSDCAETNCAGIPSICTVGNAVFQILHFITDLNFLQSKNSKLTTVITFLPLAGGKDSIDLYKYLEKEKEKLKSSSADIVAVDFGIKFDLFDYYLTHDAVWLAVALLAIIFIIWLYTDSLFITIMTLISILFALEISYFLYTYIYGITFFPFMNILTVVVIIGIGADDVFIYCKIWHISKLEKNNGTLEKIISDTLHHATIAMFVTSFTTAGAFLASYANKITAVRCFAVYAATTILINFVLMVTWIPAAIVIHEKWTSDCCVCPESLTQKKTVFYHISKIPYKVYHLITDWSRIFFEKLLPCFIIKLRYLWITLFTSLGVTGMVVVLYNPKLRLPTSSDFQVFSSDNLMEVYDKRIKHRFMFEKASLKNSGIDDLLTLPLTFVWGVKPVGNGNKLDPEDLGTMELDETFDSTTPDALQWLLKFCTKLRETNFYQDKGWFQWTDCFVEKFKNIFMTQKCFGILGDDYRPCCEHTSFPYPTNVTRLCLNRYMSQIVKQPFYDYYSYIPGLRYEKDSEVPKVLIVEFMSNVPYSLSYSEMDVFYQKVSGWMKEEMKTAPLELKGGFFTSDLQFYDLQNSIATGVPLSLAVAVGIAAAVMLCMTLNTLVSLYALISITWTIFITLGILVLLGWELNILESVIVSVSVGLSVDFTLHYGIMYKLLPDKEREIRLICVVGRTGPPVALATLTTFLAGALMMPSTILAYKQLGSFLMIVMSISWLCSTFFFLALLRTFGPQGNFGQFNWPSINCCSGSSMQHIDKTKYLFSESNVSSSASTQNHTSHTSVSEIQELVPLTILPEGDPLKHTNLLSTLEQNRQQKQYLTPTSPFHNRTVRQCREKMMAHNNRNGRFPRHSLTENEYVRTPGAAQLGQTRRLLNTST